MRLKFFLAIFILLLALSLQFWFGSVGVFINFTLAILMVFAFSMDLWELLVFILFSIYVINWQPAMSVEIGVFAIIPLVAYGFRMIFPWKPWAAIPAAILCGYFILYIFVAPRTFLGNWEGFLMDLFGSLVFAGLALLALDRAA
jgi:hypothetical protein